MPESAKGKAGWQASSQRPTAAPKVYQATFHCQLSLLLLLLLLLLPGDGFAALNGFDFTFMPILCLCDGFNV